MFFFFLLEGKRSLFPCWCTSKLCKSSSCRNPCSEVHIEKLGLWICFLACPQLGGAKTGLVENQVRQVWSKAKNQPRALPALDFGIPFLPLQLALLLLYVFVYLWWTDLGWCPPSHSLLFLNRTGGENTMRKAHGSKWGQGDSTSITATGRTLNIEMINVIYCQLKID